MNTNKTAQTLPLRILDSRKLCKAMCNAFSTGPLKRFGMRQRAVGGRFESPEKYIAERVSNIESYREAFGSFCQFQGKTVLELGCSSGYLLNAFLEQEPFIAIGADINETCLEDARSQYGERIQFIKTTPTSIPLPNESVDAIYCVDTVEHLSRPQEMLIDCHRVLRPGGVFLVHWHPWLSPYGSHLEDIIPFPWAHVLFSMENLLDVAAEIYDSPGYTPACYWMDEKTGKRRLNPYLDHQSWADFLNQMTVRKFRTLIKDLPFELVSFERHGFGGKAYKAARLLRGLAQLPVVDEFFLKAIVCVFRKPEALHNEKKLAA